MLKVTLGDLEVCSDTVPVRHLRENQLKLLVSGAKAGDLYSLVIHSDTVVYFLSVDIRGGDLRSGRVIVRGSALSEPSKTYYFELYKQEAALPPDVTLSFWGKALSKMKRTSSCYLTTKPETKPVRKTGSPSRRSLTAKERAAYMTGRADSPTRIGRARYDSAFCACLEDEPETTCRARYKIPPGRTVRCPGKR